VTDEARIEWHIQVRRVVRDEDFQPVSTSHMTRIIPQHRLRGYSLEDVASHHTRRLVQRIKEKLGVKDG